jgi:hypothetical protein
MAFFKSKQIFAHPHQTLRAARGQIETADQFLPARFSSLMQGHQMVMVWMSLIRGNRLRQASLISPELIDQQAQKSAFIVIIHASITIKNHRRQSHAGGFATA